MAPKTITMNDNQLAPTPVNIVLDEVNAQSTLEEHINADAKLLTANVGILMQVFPRLQDLSEVTHLSDQIMKVLTKRRELCLKPTCKAEAGDSEIDITPV